MPVNVATPAQPLAVTVAAASDLAFWSAKERSRMPVIDTQSPETHAAAARAKVYERPGPLAVATRPISLILVALLALVVGSLVYYKYVS